MSVERNLPKVLERQSTPAGALYTLEVLPDLVWFDGHFPDQPILPGVVQIHWVMHFAETIGFSAQNFGGLQRVKFKSIIQPHTTLQLDVSRRNQVLRFSYTSESGLYSQGSIEFVG